MFLLAWILAAGDTSGGGVNISLATLITIAVCLAIVVLIVWVASIVFGRIHRP